VREAAFTLLAASETFPPGTIHVAVVDPGVGSERPAVVGECAGRLYVGPDNGLFGYVFERAGGARVFRLTNADYFRAPVSPTFHGRDIFAPVAGALSLGVEPSQLGEPLTDWARLAPLAPARGADGALEAEIIHVDRFGNCVTNVTRRELSDAQLEGGFSLAVGERTVRRFQRFFAEGAADAGEPFALWGSAGFLEIAAYQQSAAAQLGAGRGQKIRVMSDG
jgi:S-adenosylmethionine hydrolase